MRAQRWAARHLPDLSGRSVVVTGANSGIGLHTARFLGAAGAEVVLACRSVERARAATHRWPTGAPAPVAAELDLSELASVHAFAGWFEDHVGHLDVLVNNAGVMAILRELTVDGFERQLATNHLGHAALTGLLLPVLLRSPAPRVVTVTSFLARTSRIRFEDLQGEASYDPWTAYGQSKLANHHFGAELARRSEAARSPLVSVVAHPGYARTQLVANGPRSSSRNRTSLDVGSVLVAQSAADGALPSVMAAADPTIGNGALVVPRGPGHLRGRPRTARPPAAARDRDVAERLWELTGELTGVPIDLG